MAKARDTESGMTLAQHFAEARRRFLICVAITAAMAVVSFVIYPSLLRLLQHPYCQVDPRHCNFLVTNPLDGITLRVKIALFGGLLFATPFWLWHTWRFVTPGLKARERRYALPFVLGSMVFFFGGVVTAYLVFKKTIQFLVSIGGSSLTSYYNPNQYLTLFLLMMLLFGLTFEFPVVLVALELARVVSPAQLLRSWRYSVIAIVVFSGVITPSSDPFSMFALMIPLVVFYFLAIGLGKLLHR
ncbi:MAG: twin-arginine translocase subunit TatC [Acidobacteria bacterium]|nr:twin-arginine translocase subunit TatC [Acidobacteriota bacterium]